MSCGRFGNEPLSPNVSIFLRSSEILEGLRNINLKNEEAKSQAEIPKCCTPDAEDSGLRTEKSSPQREYYSRAENAEVIIIDDDDDPIAEPPAKRRTVVRSRSFRNTASNAFQERISATGSDPNPAVGLSALQKWRLCTMWRTNKSLSDIAISLDTHEAILQSYIYDLIKQDAMKSGPRIGGGFNAK